jgi:hypothetical protein
MIRTSQRRPSVYLVFLKVADRKAVGYEALCAHHHRPASLRIPGGTAQDLVTPQGFKLGHCLLNLVTTPGGLAMPVVELIRRCGLHHSLGLRMATNFIVNVIYYSYREARRLSAHRQNVRRTRE